MSSNFYNLVTVGKFSKKPTCVLVYPVTNQHDLYVNTLLQMLKQLNKDCNCTTLHIDNNYDPVGFYFFNNGEIKKKLRVDEFPTFDILKYVWNRFFEKNLTNSNESTPITTSSILKKIENNTSTDDVREKTKKIVNISRKNNRIEKINRQDGYIIVGDMLTFNADQNFPDNNDNYQTVYPIKENTENVKKNEMDF